MKAIILAGGEGTRLRPLTSRRPKPMVRLLDRPILDYTIELLRKNGFDDICITLRYRPDEITARYGDGKRFGVSICTRTEKAPLGTAGSVRACADFASGEDVLIISGDCVCGFDLCGAMEKHKSSGAFATVITTACDDPTEYGAVISDESGKILRFSEKPAWENVVTADISTGIYILSRGALELIPENAEYDFARGLFPEILRRGLMLLAVRADGYWCDIGSPEAYLQCTSDALRGLIPISPAAPKIRAGVFSASPLPAGAVAAPPVYIGENVLIEPGARIGPDAVIGSGSRICRNAFAEKCVLDGAVMKNGSSASGTILCEGAMLGENAVISRGCIVGDGAYIGEGALLSENVLIPPDASVPDFARLRPGMYTEAASEPLHFSHGGVILPDSGSEITPDLCLKLGAAAASFGICCISHDGSPASFACALAAESGALACGGRAVMTDASYDASASFAGKMRAAGLSVFIACGKDAPYIRFFGETGLPLSRTDERKIEAALRAGHSFVRTHAVKSGERISGTAALFAAEAARTAKGPLSCTVSVPGRSASARAVREALRLCGCTLSYSARQIPALFVSDDGFSLCAADENGEKLSSEQLLLITAFCAYEHGEKTVAAPPDAPAAIEKLGIPILRGGGEAESLLAEQPFMRYAAFQAVMICSALRNGVGLSDLKARLPHFYTAVREIPLSFSRAAAMDALRREGVGFSEELSGGISFAAENGAHARISPCREKNALFLRAEGHREEYAEELADSLARRIRSLRSE